MNKLIFEGIQIAFIDPAAVPTLRIAGGMFLIINVLAGAWLWSHRRKLFGPDSNADGDRPATRYLQALVLGIPWLFMTFRLLFEWVGLWIE